MGLTLLLLRTISNINATDEPFTSWVGEKNLLYTTASHQAEAYNNQIYVFGGAGIANVFHSNILSANINQNGSLSEWQTISHLPEKIIWHNTVRDNNNIYLLGGAKKDPTVLEMSTLDTVYLYPINQNGTLAQRKDLTKLPKNLAMGGVVIYNNKIYYMGGFIRNPSTSTPNFESSIYSAEIYPDGTTGI